MYGWTTHSACKIQESPLQGGSNLASLPVSQQGGLPQGSMPQGGNPMQNMFLRPAHSSMPQGSLLHQFPMTAQGPHLPGQQQPGLPGLRPASFLQVAKSAKKLLLIYALALCNITAPEMEEAQ